jgi:hypothetical protein
VSSFLSSVLEDNPPSVNQATSASALYNSMLPNSLTLHDGSMRPENHGSDTNYDSTTHDFGLFDYTPRARLLPEESTCHQSPMDTSLSPWEILSKPCVTTARTRAASEAKRRHEQKFECTFCHQKFTTKNKRDRE